MEIAQALTTVPVKNDDQYIWITLQLQLYIFEITTYENQTFFLM